ncbi:MAG TPA: hypothetical protein VFC05_15385 [Nitrososphaeraceae archaeon]|nr:hypothetical protein [Nitrososphaeraceae archaeon]
MRWSETVAKIAYLFSSLTNSSKVYFVDMNLPAKAILRFNVNVTLISSKKEYYR